MTGLEVLVGLVAFSGGLVKGREFSTLQVSNFGRFGGRLGFGR